LVRFPSFQTLAKLNNQRKSKQHRGSLCYFARGLKLDGFWLANWSPIAAAKIQSSWPCRVAACL
jgi:hypothetical protein